MATVAILAAPPTAPLLAAPHLEEFVFTVWLLSLLILTLLGAAFAILCFILGCELKDHFLGRLAKGGIVSVAPAAPCPALPAAEGVLEDDGAALALPHSELITE